MPVRDTLQVGYGYRLRWWRGRQGREQIKSHTGRAGCLCSNEAWPWETAWARAWPLNAGEQGKAADPYLSPFDFSFIIRSIHFSRSLAFHPLLTPHPSLSQPLSLSIVFLWGTVFFLSAPSQCHHQSFRLMTVLNGSSKTALSAFVRGVGEL